MPRFITLRHKYHSFKKKRVTFSSEETIHLFNAPDNEINRDNNSGLEPSSMTATSQLTEEIKILSSQHGRSRRHLREIPKYSLQAAVKYGKKVPAYSDRQTGLPRWKYTFAIVVYITDYTSTKEITSYKEPVSIASAPISTDILKRHEHVKRIIKEEPHMCTSHFVVIVDQSGSMRTADVNGFRNRSQAAYGCLALDCIAEQLSHLDESMNAGIDTLTIIEMNDSASVVFEREPLDWILFNKLLARQTRAKPRSHGNYGPSIQVAKNIIQREVNKLHDVEPEDLPAFAIILLSDGKPSDKNEKSERINIISSLSMELKDKFTFYGMGIGANGSDFGELQSLSMAAKIQGSKGEFNHAGISAANIGDGLSSITSSMSTVRSELLTKTDVEDELQNNAKPIVPLKQRKSFAKSIDDCWKKLIDVSRYKFDLNAWEKGRGNFFWREIPMIHWEKNASGFAMDKFPFAEGAERQAYRFCEVNTSGEMIGKMLVAKESRKVIDDKKKFHFHQHFCRIQAKASELARAFNADIYKTKSLRPLYDYECSPPKIIFAKCFIYKYIHEGKDAEILVEHYLKGRFTKYNGNNGFVNRKEAERDPITLTLQNGEATLIDFIQAFSHWSYVKSDQKLLLCDLQGVLDKEGRKPTFKLTDPAICTCDRDDKTRKYGKTDIGLKGIRQFFRNHKCNLVCKCLGLPQG